MVLFYRIGDVIGWEERKGVEEVSWKTFNRLKYGRLSYFQNQPCLPIVPHL